MKSLPFVHRYKRSIWIVALVACLCFIPDLYAGEDSSRANSSSGVGKIREDILRLDLGDEDVDAAIERLKARPRAEVINVLKDEIGSGPRVSSGALRAVSILEAFELLPQLKKAARKSEDWKLFAAINSLLGSRAKDDDWQPLYLVRLGDLLSVPAKVAVLDGLAKLGAPLPKDRFEDLIASTDHELRIALVQHFLATRTKLAGKDLDARYRRVLKLKPYQARLLAFEEVTRFSKAELERLRTAFSAELCASESESEVKEACENAAKRVSSPGGGR